MVKYTVNEEAYINKELEMYLQYYRNKIYNLLRISNFDIKSIERWIRKRISYQNGHTATLRCRLTVYAVSTLIYEFNLGTLKLEERYDLQSRSYRIYVDYSI